MKRFALVTNIALAALLGMICEAGQAAVVFSSGAPNQVEGRLDDRKTDFFDLAQPFSLAPGLSTITGVQWFGGCAPGSSCSGNDSFNVNIYTDSAGKPGTVVANLLTAGNANRTATGQLILNLYQEYRYSISFSPLILSANTPYWLEISNAATSNDWYWETANPAQSSAYRNTFTAGQWVIFPGVTYAMQLTNGNAPPVLAPIGNKSVNEEQPLSFTVTATDADNDPLYFAVSGLPPGASANQDGPLFFGWTPDSSQAGVYYVRFMVTDLLAVATEDITITVNNAVLDSDLDGVPDSIDNCPFVPNPDQADQDHDGVGDVCDNSPLNYNPSQTDSNGNGVGDASESQVTATVTPTSSTGYAPGEPILLTATVTFNPSDFNGDSIPDRYLVLRPNPYNVILHLLDGSGHDLPATQIPEGGPINFSMDPMFTDFAVVTTSAQTFNTTLNLRDWYPNLAPGNYTVQATYVNFAKDLDVDKNGVCRVSECFAPIWTGTAPAGSTTVVALTSTQVVVNAIDALIAKVNGLGLDKGLANSLVSKLNAAKSYLQKNDLPHACAKLTDFIGEVTSQSGKKLTVAQANDLIASDQQIKGLLACR